MKNIGLTLSILVTTFVIQAQTNSNHLWAVYRAPNSSSFAKAKALQELFKRELIPFHPDTTIAYGNALQKLARKTGDRNAEATGFYFVGAGLLNFNRYNEADSCFSRALSIFTVDVDETKKAKVWMQQGLVAGGRGLNELATDLLTKAMGVAVRLEDKKLRSAILTNQGNLLANVGDLAGASKKYTSALQLAEALADTLSIASNLANLGNCYNGLRDPVKALAFQSRAVDIYTRTKNNKLCMPLLNMASTYMSINIDSSFAYAERSAKAAEEFNNLGVLAMTYGLRAMLYRNQGMLDSALSFQKQGAILAENNENLGFAARLQLDMAMTLADQHRMPEAIAKAKDVLRMAEENRDLQMQTLALEFLWSRQRMNGNYKEAFDAYTQYVILTDSLKREQNQRETIRQEYKYGYEKQALADSLSFASEKTLQQKEVQKQKLMRNGFMGGFALVAIFAGVFFFQRNRIGKEKARSEELLLNILPEEIADELKEKGHSDAQLIDHVTVLFTDFKGFTAMSEILSANDLVKDLHYCFSEFDRICEKYNIEKIKTIGDAYMAAGGLPMPNKTHPFDAVNAGLEMLEVIAQIKTKKIELGLPFFEIRIGVHTGPVVAGIVGVKKFQYDIWGDTVNTASRMESSCEVGRVNISQTTYALINDDPEFTFENRGKIEAKGKGELEMWFVSKA
jgi:adenylate cyclase|tara:strand:- start:19966 stop:22008 length:2043 start_codon:yes stop_codon:yes gene_type:complete